MELTQPCLPSSLGQGKHTEWAFLGTCLSLLSCSLLLPVHISNINLDTHVDKTSARLNDPKGRIQNRHLFLWNGIAWSVQNELDVSLGQRPCAESTDCGRVRCN